MYYRPTGGLKTATSWVLICHLYMVITRAKNGSALSGVGARKGA